MATIKLIGDAPNQVSRNKDLGELAFQDSPFVPAPASATAQGEVGDLAADTSYIYVCVAQNTWLRASIATW
jgi:hypothetical protein